MKKNNDLISIIIPCYNSEKYLARCLDSVIKQNYKNIEIIIVNDGSSDSSLDIIKSYKDSRIIIVDKKNEGSWQARIDGIKKSTGKYISFVDSDDVVSKSFIKNLYSSIIKNVSDISICGFDRISLNNDKVLSKEMISFIDSIKLFDDINQVPLINTSNWNKLYKRELFNDVFDYKVSSRTCEDLILNMFAYFNTCKISFVSNVLYHYYVNDNSIMNTLSSSDIKSIEESFLNLRVYAEKNNKMFLPCIDFMAVIHLGISLTSRIYKSKDLNRRMLIKDICNNIRNNHKLYKKFKTNNLKLNIIKLVFRLRLTYLFVAVYSFVISTLKIEIKW
ncbi:MAG: glycosyltransferase family 2 protein [Bacilli bacterium]|nr:glycosyltransferase family 2 protein [Bacilli bacterium]